MSTVDVVPGPRHCREAAGRFEWVYRCCPEADEVDWGQVAVTDDGNLLMVGPDGSLRVEGLDGRRSHRLGTGDCSRRSWVIAAEYMTAEHSWENTGEWEGVEECLFDKPVVAPDEDEGVGAPSCCRLLHRLLGRLEQGLHQHLPANLDLSVDRQLTDLESQLEE